MLTTGYHPETPLLCDINLGKNIQNFNRVIGNLIFYSVSETESSTDPPEADDKMTLLLRCWPRTLSVTF